jgi:hypothetical protein
MSTFAKNYYQGTFVPKHPEKCLNYNRKLYPDKVLPITYRSSWEQILCNFCDMEVYVLAWGSEVVEIPYYSQIDQKTHRYVLDFLIILRNKRGELKKWAVEVKPDNQAAYLDKMGNVIYPPAPKRKTQKAMARWQEKCQVIRRIAEKWDAAKEWTKRRGFEFCVKTEKEIFGLAGEHRGEV